MIADLWGQVLALMLAWPPITPIEIEVWLTLGGPSTRAVRSWLTVVGKGRT